MEARVTGAEVDMNNSCLASRNDPLSHLKAVRQRIAVVDENGVVPGDLRPAGDARLA
jgi:hypothetical protein